MNARWRPVLQVVAGTGTAFAAPWLTGSGGEGQAGQALSFALLAGLVLGVGYADKRPVRVHAPFSLGGSLGALVYLSRTYRLALISFIAASLALAVLTPTQ